MDYFFHFMGRENIFKKKKLMASHTVEYMLIF